MEDLRRYIKDTLGFDVEIKPVGLDKLNALPVYILNEFDFQYLNLYNQDILLVIIKNSFTTDRLRQHIDIIRNALNLLTVAVITHLEAYNRLRLIEKKVPFIIPAKQIYMPDLLIDLKDFGIKPKVQPQIMQPAAQFLLLYHLQVQSLEGINLKSIAEKLFYNAMTITRAVYYLHNIGLCTLQGTKDKFLHFSFNNIELWQKAEPLLNSPVKNVDFYNGLTLDRNIRKSGINALAHYSDLNDEVIDYYAVRPGYRRFIEGVNLQKSVPLEGNVCVEEWKYDPSLLTKTEFVDPLSLYLCFRNRQDERIGIALEQIIKNVKWSED